MPPKENVLDAVAISEREDETEEAGLSSRVSNHEDRLDSLRNLDAEEQREGNKSVPLIGKRDANDSELLGPADGKKVDISLPVVAKGDQESAKKEEVKAAEPAKRADLQKPDAEEAKEEKAPAEKVDPKIESKTSPT